MSCPIQAVGHAVKTWSAVCSMAQHLECRKKARPYCAWTSGIAQGVRNELIPTGLVLVMGMKLWSCLDFQTLSVSKRVQQCLIGCKANFLKIGEGRSHVDINMKKRRQYRSSRNAICLAAELASLAVK